MDTNQTEHYRWEVSFGETPLCPLQCFFPAVFRQTWLALGVSWEEGPTLLQTRLLYLLRDPSKYSDSSASQSSSIHKGMGLWGHSISTLLLLCPGLLYSYHRWSLHPGIGNLCNYPLVLWDDDAWLTVTGINVHMWEVQENQCAVARAGAHKWTSQGQSPVGGEHM